MKPKIKANLQDPFSGKVQRAFEKQKQKYGFCCFLVNFRVLSDSWAIYVGSKIKKTSVDKRLKIYKEKNFKLK